MNQILNLLGLANRAGKIISGENFCVDALRKGHVSLIFLAKDAGVNTSKRINDKANFYHCDVIRCFTSIEISNAIGKSNRMVLGVIDQGFAKKMKETGDLYGKN